MGERCGDDRSQVRRPRRHRESEDRDEHRRLGNRRDGHRPARSHASERGAGVETGERQEDRAEQQQVHDREQVADLIECGFRGQERNDSGDERCRGEQHERGDREHPAGVVGDHPILAEQLAQIAPRLHDRRPDPSLEPGTDQTHHADEERRRSDGQHHLQQGDGSAGEAHRATIRTTMRVIKEKVR